MPKHKLQVSPQHYNNNYDDVHRFISYHYQISSVVNIHPKNILEIWVGNKLVSDYLRRMWYVIDTCDFDPLLEPDYIADVCKLPFSDNAYDVIMICQVLEHLPFADFEIALTELTRVSSKYVIISLPYSSLNFEFIFRIPFLNKIIKKIYWSTLFRIPRFYSEHQFDGQHYWEVWKKGYSLSKIRHILNQYFMIEHEFTPILNPYHHFFILRKSSN